ncbi:hypothetical protein CIG75_01550 [Tumebacillus algifaecis]|uniref:DNA mismatch repair proteins mutS family domain-containing protein n=1 Tax=Tumebacillus algifaecis TaxID=1214604 RepID=A0A223CX83_9BACL|nr:hypothetical protein [Tumebacillus algifaecis]ASS73784.1 hypothetical protein CIG75_01550 [Tumebacillus algifaecis]
MTSQADRAYWDETTKQLLGWPEVLAMLQPVSKAGLRAKREIRPFGPQEHALWQERMEDLRAVQAVRDDAAWVKELQEELQMVPDLRALFQLIGQGATLRQADFFEVKQFLWHGYAVEELLVQKGLVFGWWEALAWEPLLRRLNPPGPLVPAFSLAELAGDVELLRLHQELSVLDEALFAEKKAQGDRLRAQYGRKPGKDGQLVFDKLDAALGVARQDADLMLLQDTVFEVVFRTAESLAMTELVQRREAKLAEIEDQETATLQALVEAFRPDVEAMSTALEALGRVDLTLAKAALANKWSAGLPEWITAAGQSVVFEVKAEAVACAGLQGVSSAEHPADAHPVYIGWSIEAGFHPVAREAVEKRGGTFTTLDFELQPGVGLITGPNMGGKTVVLKTFGLLQALAQHAMPVPARRYRFHPLERIGVSGGDEQSMVSGLSSFGAEMQRLAALVNGTGRALLLLDEVARTTNPEEGEALAIGLASYLLNSGHSALFASHFPGVTEVSGLQLYRVAGLKRSLLDHLQQASEQSDVLQRLQSAMDYTLVKSGPGDVPKDAVRLAECFGLPQAVLDKTQAVLQRKEGPTG